jgi:carboxypeptidase C (cathepsin A)
VQLTSSGWVDLWVLRCLVGGAVHCSYATSYSVVGSQTDFSFVTIRLAGHMVPTFQPEAAFSFFKRYLQNTPF